MTRLRRRLFGRKQPPSPLHGLKLLPQRDMRRLGSPYGGWVISHSSELKRGTFLSAGVGEDVSFDVELASLYQMRGVLIDPTPRAIKYLHSMEAHFGTSRCEPYTLDGFQPIRSYDLSAIDAASFLTVPKALWVHDDGVNFLPPENPSNVSYSLFSKQSSSTAGTHLRVPSVSPATLATQVAVEDVKLIKLDVEGAEVDVIDPLLRNFTSVEQLLVEFDIEKVAREKSRELLEEALNCIDGRGFDAAHRSGRNLLFVRTR